MTATMQAAHNSKSDKHLSQYVNTSAFGICTRKQRIEQGIAIGCRFESALVRDEARERAIERELKAMQGRDGWGVPTGNPRHPTTIKYNSLRTELANGPRCAEYRLHIAGKDYWTILTKTEFDYAIENGGKL